MISLFGGVVPSVPGAAVVPAGPGRTAAMEEFGATGTPILGGFLRDAGEYNADLSGLAAFPTYEQMRRGDAQVAATLMALKLPIRSAEWTVVEPVDATPVEREAAEFVEQELLENLELDGVIENALLMLDFGVSAHEDVWRIDGNRIRLAKLAPRLPLTFARWIVDGSEKLIAIEQQGWRGEQYVTVALPAAKAAVFTFQQEGSNFAGRSILRPMYKHWYMKDKLYAVDAIACERNGMGIPVVTMGPGAKAEDIRTARAWVESIAAHEHAGLNLPQGWTFDLKGVTGTLRDPKDSIAHHNVQISMAGLAQFMVLGQSESGNRALGQTMSDFFYMALQATANKIARVINWSTITRLVDMNFTGVKRYPELVPQQILSLRFEAVVEALQKLGTAGFVVGDPDMEKWLREKMGAPEKAVATAAAAGAGAGAAAIPGDTGAAAAEGASGAENAKSGADSGAAEKLAADMGMAPGGMRRAPRGVERYLAASEIVGRLDQGRDEVAAALRAARPRIQAEIIHKLLNRPVRDMHQASVAADTRLISEVEGLLRDVSDFGVAQVNGERARQLAGKAPSEAAMVRAAAIKRDALGVYADGLVSEFQNTLSARATNAMVARRVRGDVTDGELIRQVESDLDEQSDKWVDGVAAKGTNAAFAEGRDEGYAAHADEIASVIYSALLDINTCPACAEADGQEGATPDDIPGVPNPDCDGGDRCRCVHVYVFADEVKIVA